jgi:uncharacterized membrane protein
MGQARFGWWRWAVMMFFATAISAYAIALVIIGEPMYGPQLVASFKARPWGINPHALFGAVALFLGAFQFLPAIRRRPRVHRMFGRIYVGAAVLTGGAGLYMAPYSYGGWITHLGFAGLAVALLTTTLAGLAAIRRGEQYAHRAWMTRSYALMFAAVTLRIELPLLIVFFRGNFDPAYRIVAWLCWLPNLVAAEWMLRRFRARWADRRNDSETLSWREFNRGESS